jgi:hypothetical protein
MKKLVSVLLAFMILGSVLITSCFTGVLAETAEEENDTAELMGIDNPESMEKTVTLSVSGFRKNGNGNDQKAEKYSMYAGQELKLKTDSGKTVRWNSSDETVASVVGKNRIKALKAGKVTLEGKAGSKKYRVKLTVNGYVTASTKKVSMKVGSKKTVKITFPHTGTVYWHVENPNIVRAAWDQKGFKNNVVKLHLTGLSKGTTYVTVTNNLNSDKVKIKVTVGEGSQKSKKEKKKKEEETTSSKAKYRALLIGNSNYSRNPLPNHKWDVTAMKGLLTKSLKTKYSVNDKYDCSAGSILSAIRSTFSGAKERDVSLFYFAGHGGAYDGALYGVDNKYVYPSQLRDALLGIPGKVIVILECCHSGSMVTANGSDSPEETGSPDDFNRAIVDAFSGYTIPIVSEDDEDSLKANTGELRESKFIVLTACKKYEESWNWWYYDPSRVSQSFGTFTRTLFNGLGCSWSSGIFQGSAPCDSSKDGVASLGECYSYVKKHATGVNQQMGGYNVQTCMYYGSKNYKLFQLKR